MSLPPALAVLFSHFPLQTGPLVPASRLFRRLLWASFGVTLAGLGIIVVAGFSQHPESQTAQWFGVGVAVGGQVINVLTFWVLAAFINEKIDDCA